MRELNLIPYEIKQRREANRKRKIYSAVTITFIAILAAGLISLKFVATIYQYKVLSLQYEINNKKKVNTEADALDSQINIYTAYNNKVKELTSEKIMISDRINATKQYFPKDVVANSINYSDKNGIVLTAETTDYNSIGILAANLQLSNKYKSVRIANINFNKDKNKYTFTVNVAY
ncbi:MAG: hypothetical protein Q8936_00960 [Bacillota bacterium]|nr:hypothetical protein [Bacillota bacterium]